MISLDAAFPVSICEAGLSDHSPERFSLSVFTQEISGLGWGGGIGRLRALCLLPLWLSPTPHDLSVYLLELSQALVTFGTLPTELSLHLWASAKPYFSPR